jgi:hypothetical protein
MNIKTIVKELKRNRIAIRIIFKNNLKINETFKKGVTKVLK